MICPSSIASRRVRLIAVRGAINVGFRLGLAVALLGAAMSSVIAQAPTPIAIRFQAKVGDRDLVCGQRYGAIGTTKTTIELIDLRFYVSEVHLVRTDGRAVPVALAQDGIWQHRNVALVDLEDASGGCRNGTKATHAQVTGMVPAGDYRGLRFTLGVPVELNHQDPTIAPSPLNLTAMFWNWQGGYKFLKLDFASEGLARAAMSTHDGHAGHGAAAAATSGFAVHLGSTRCQSPAPTQAPTTCANSNRVSVAFDRFDAARDVVLLDIGALLAETNADMNTPKTSPGCMSFPGDADCKPIMRRLGLAYDDAPPGKQLLFRVQ